MHTHTHIHSGKRYLAASVRCCRCPAGVVTATYKGPLTLGSAQVLFPFVQTVSTGCGGLIERFDAALLAHAPLLAVPGNWPCFGAFVCSAADFDQVSEFALRLTRVGLLRTVWTSEHLHLAREWMLRMDV